jgi:hypothetical protein
MPDYPTPHSITQLKRQLPAILKEMLDYCACQALESNLGTLSYEYRTDEVTYYLKVDDSDRALFDALHGVDEIWIMTAGASGGVN